MSKATDFLIDCGNPKAFDETIQQLGAAVLIQKSDSRYEQKDGHYIMRVFGDPGFLKFAIEHQGYGKIVKQLETIL